MPAVTPTTRKPVNGWTPCPPSYRARAQSGRTFCWSNCWSTLGKTASTCRSQPIPVTSTPSRPTRKSVALATSRSKSGCVPTCAGTPWPWWSRPTGIIRSTVGTWAATSAPLPRWPICLAPALTTSGTLKAPYLVKNTAVTASTSRGTCRPVSMPAPTSKAA